VLPDGLESRIIREEMTLRFRAGDMAGGITAAVLRAAERIASDKGVTLEWNGAELRYDTTRRDRSERGLPPLAIAIFILIVILRLVLGGWMGPGAFGGRRRGWTMGSGGWGGGFGGGFGGGGASFGGFGGGSSGGGGGSGGW